MKITRKDLMKLLDVHRLTVIGWERRGWLKRVADRPVAYRWDEKTCKRLLEHFQKLKRQIPDFLLQCEREQGR